MGYTKRSFRNTSPFCQGFAWHGSTLGLASEQAHCSRGRLVFFRFMAVVVENGNALKGRGRICNLGKVLVAVETNRDPNLGFGLGLGARIDLHCRLLRRVVLRQVWRQGYTQNAATATDSHIVAERDLGRHVEGELDRCALGEGCVGEKEDAARADVLGKAPGFDAAGDVANEDGKKKRKALSGAAFDSDWRRIHGGKLPSCLLAAGGA